MTAYYNEINPYAAQWLRNLIDAGHIAPGLVDERSIEDVFPSDLRGFTQCHFFAGIGVWSRALRAAGWRDDRPVWTGSCPCQPFSSAGQGAGFDDKRHLWPHFHHLIKECRPAIVAGEQVASKDADPWIDLVCADLEALGYAFGAVPFPAAGVGTANIRDRIYWMAYTGGRRRQWRQGPQVGGIADRDDAGRDKGADATAGTGEAGAVGLANSNQHGCSALPFGRGHNAEHHAEPCSEPGRLGHADIERAGRDGRAVPGQMRGQDGQHLPVDVDAPGAGLPAGPGPVNGLWSAADWLLCRDAKWRPVEPGTFPLAHGAPARVGRLRAYGNAINAEAARVFIECVMECTP